MRRNLLIGLCLTALVGLAAGDYTFNRLSGAQDAPKKAEPEEKKSDLFELLKKELEGKKESVTLPAPGELPPPSGLVPTTAQDKQPLPPVVDAPTPAAPLPLPQGKPEEPKPLLPPGPVIPAPTPIAPPKAVDPVMPLPSSGIGSQPPANLTPPPSLPPVSAPERFVAPAEARDDTPGNLKQAFDPVPIPMKRKEDAGKPAQSGVLPSASVVPPTLPPVRANETAKPEPAKTKTSPWTLHIEIVDDMTIVTATVNKKHEFKVVCQNLEVMTGKDAFKASGKVKISGDCMAGSCERLAISLTDDRLVLEGAAELQIQKTILQVSSDDGKPAAFELKGETLNLRISELQSGKYTQTSWSSPDRVIVEGPAKLKPLAAEPMASSKEWSPYGKLRRVDGNWRLEDNAGRLMLRLETTNGQLLESYHGRNISVFGPMVDRMTVRVTHIAVP